MADCSCCQHPMTQLTAEEITELDLHPSDFNWYKCTNEDCPCYPTMKSIKP